MAKMAMYALEVEEMKQLEEEVNTLRAGVALLERFSKWFAANKDGMSVSEVLLVERLYDEVISAQHDH